MSSPTSSSAITVPTVPTVDASEDIVNMDLASSYRPASAAGSDDSDTAAGSVMSDGETTDAIVVPYTGPLGFAYEEHTDPADIKDWPVYLSFCEDGPTLSLECIDSMREDGTGIRYNEMKVPKKLLCDFSGYFKAMLRHEFQETKAGRVQFIDIVHEDMMRLKLILLSGTGQSYVNIGKEEEEMGNLVRAYELADRFDMPVVKTWIMTRTTNFILSHRNWKDVYHREVIDAPPVSIITTLRENFHRAKLLDFCDAYKKLVDLPEQARLADPSQLAGLIADSCHPLLLRSMLRNMDQDAWYGVSEIFLTNMSI